MQKINITLRCAVLAGLAAAGVAAGMARPSHVLAQTPAQAPAQAPAPAPAPAQGPAQDPGPGFQEFLDRVQQYVKLHKSVEGKMPKLKSTKEPELIEAHQKIMARKIREAREHAKQGDIFTQKATESFRQVIAGEFHGPQATNAQATMKQGAPLKEVHLRVNRIYPSSVPYTSVPPTLLQKLPTLPPEVAYRVVSHDLVLLDVKANVVLDYLPGVIPLQASTGG